MANTLAALGVGGQTSILAQATLLSQAKNYSGAGKWFNEVGAGYFQPGSVLGAYIGPTSYGAGNALILPGVSGNYASAPDAAPLDITGDISLMACANPDWTPASTSNRLIAKNNVGTQCSYWFGVATTGIPFLAWSPDGTVGAALSRSATTAVPFADLATGWLAATLDVDNGAAGHDVKFYTSTDGSSWSQLGSTVTTAGTTSIHSGSAVLEMGTSSTGTLSLHAMTMFRSQVWTGVRDFVAGTGGTLAFDADFTAQATGTTSFTESSSNAATVTVTSTGADTNDPQWLPHSTSQNPFGAGVDYVYLPGASGNYISTPDTAALDITGDIELIARISVVQWVSGGDRAIISKHGATSGDYGPYAWRVSNNGTMLLGLAPTSTTFQSHSSTAGLSGSLTKWLKATATISGCTVRFYYSNDTTNDPSLVTWTKLGADVTTATIATLVDSNNPVCIGTWHEGGTSDQFNGSITRALVYNGIGGTLAADFNPDGGTINSTATSLTGTGDGLTWTINRAATGRKTTWVDRDRFMFGTDDRMQSTGITPPWNGTEVSFTQIVAFRYFGTTIGGGKIIFGNSRMGIAASPAGAGIGSNFSNQLVTRLSDATTQIAGGVVAVSTFNGTQSGFSDAYDPSAETIKTVYSANAGSTVSSSTTGALSDLGNAGNSTVNIAYQPTDGAYFDGEIVGVAAFNRVLTDAEIQQAIQELYA